MLKLSKKAEYALMAVKYIATKQPESCVTAKQIAESYQIPYELLAKVLQQLVKFNIIRSFQGINGGYSLTKSPDKITLIDIIKAIDPDYRITECMKEKSSSNECSHFDCCSIRDPLMKVQREIDKVFKNTTITQII